MSECVRTPNILLPKNVDMEKWSVVACDQFTSQLDYWEKLEDFIGDSPSTLKLIYPEVYLSSDNSARIESIVKSMNEYLESNLFEERKNIMVLAERDVEEGKKRKGLVLSVDLDKYDWRRVNTQIRATEDTIIDRLPPRVAIRKNAHIEFPHILLMIDDEKKSVIEPIYNKRNDLKKIYDFNLNMEGGHIIGYEVNNTKDIIEAIEKLADPALQKEKYGYDAKIVFAVGDGNHSLATAKVCWEEKKKTLSEVERENHPARYALVEVVNIYDEALIFEPIHRVVFNYPEDLKDTLQDAVTKGYNKIEIIVDGKKDYIMCCNSPAITIKEIQDHLESRLCSDMEIDYIHGDAHLEKVVKERNGFGIKMPTFNKSELFNFVLNVGNLPKKAFSIGGAEYKKYYLEGKKIILEETKND